jgi:hypothetical protein
VPDRRRHRGPHPGDRERFGSAALPALRDAVTDLSLLLGLGYAETAALKLVGDRFGLDARQRTAVRRAACTDSARAARAARRTPAEHLGGRTLWIDGFNVLTTVEAALAGGVLLRCRDGCLRDMAGMHGSWKRVEETRPALEAIGRTLATIGTAGARWLFDSPVSNSGRIAGLVRELADEQGWDWTATPDPDPDRTLIAAREVVVASADSHVLDLCGDWFDLASGCVDDAPELDLATP